ncbi:MAG TPA: HAD family hydrolase [Candidatus Krumholzibacteria bacterium]|nr:HAD family hydrolase [Candidatus Krumholzibacteria bacterium]
MNNHKHSMFVMLAVCVLLGVFAFGCSSHSEQAETSQPATATAPIDPLASWNDTPIKTAIIDFVRHTSSPGDPEFVPEADRVAVFDNDGTLWAEQPMYFQLAFAIDRIVELAPQHPEWKNREPFRSLLEGNVRNALAGGDRAILDIIKASHAGMTTDEFEQIVKDWIAVASHPTLHRAYIQCAYQPMLELLAYLRANGYRTFIVSGGGIEFMRPWTERVYGIPAEQVVGSQIKVKLEDRNGRPVLVRLPDIEFIDDGPGKPVAIHRFIGKRPVMAFGNSDGDLEMLRWTAAGKGARFCALIHHTDDAREWAYDRESAVGHLDKALDEARAKSWSVVDMKNDWKTVFPAVR